MSLSICHSRSERIRESTDSPPRPCCPLLAGPGAVVAAMLLMGRSGEAADKTMVSGGIVAALVVVWLALRLAAS